MSNSYLSRHRPICTVLEEIRKCNNATNADALRPEINALIDEAKDYAQRMSNRLMEYKRKEQGNVVEPASDDADT